MKTPKKVLYWHETGPLVAREGQDLWVEDLNPQTTIRFRMTRWELARMGIRAVWAAIRG